MPMPRLCQVVPVLSSMLCAMSSMMERSPELAAIMALDAPPASYLWQVANAIDAGATPEDLVGVLIAIAPQIGGPKLVAAAPELMVALGLSLPHSGSHTLRYACASHLLEEGLSLEEIGDHLGHRSLESTRIYAKVDLHGLREVAAFDLGEVV